MMKACIPRVTSIAIYCAYCMYGGVVRTAQPLWEPVVEVLGRVWGVTVTSQTVSMLSLQLNCHGRMPCRRQLAAGSKLWVTL